jgi:hypothetical protein
MRLASRLVLQLSLFDKVEARLLVDFVAKHHLGLVIAHLLDQGANIHFQNHIGDCEVLMIEDDGVALIEQLFSKGWGQFIYNLSLHVSFP